jgi:hypothetical protein
MTTKIASISFPEITVHTRDAHKLRGYFGNLFKEKSPILHNHFESGESRYSYPLVQYKIINKIPYLVGINEGCELLKELFLEINQLTIDDKTYQIYEKQLTTSEYSIGITADFYKYKFLTLWMALNQTNFPIYDKYIEEEDKKILLKKILTGNILSLFKYLNYHAEEKIEIDLSCRERVAQFKGKNMIAFSGHFLSNVLIPDLVGLGKSVSRGFGTIKRIK